MPKSVSESFAISEVHHIDQVCLERFFELCKVSGFREINFVIYDSQKDSQTS